MSTTQEERPQYYEGQYLGAADLSATVDYGRSQQARHLLGAHTWGIAVGLQLQEVAVPGGGINVVVSPGYAWDGFGRPVVVLAPFAVGPELFQSFSDPSSSANGVLIDVWLRYSEGEARPAPAGFADCDSGDLNSRIVESFRLEVGDRSSIVSRRDPLSIAGRSVDAAAALGAGTTLADASVPFQALPDDPLALWLIALGKVRWKPGTGGGAGAFQPRTPDDLAKSGQSRAYVGVVCGSVLAADGSIVLADRTRDFTTPPFKDQDLVTVQGNLAAGGDVRLKGTRVDFRDSKESTQGTPMTLGRADYPSGDRVFSATLGEKTDPKVRFSVGPFTDATHAVMVEQFVVLASGNVGIGTTTPITALQLPDRGVEIGISDTPTDNFHIVSDTTGGPRALRFYNKDFGSGAHLASFLNTGNVGIATPNPAVSLHVMGNRFRLEGGGKTIDLRTDGSAVDLHSETTDLYLRGSGPGGKNRVLINPFPGTDGFVGIATQTPLSPLHVNGEVRLGDNGRYLAPGGEENLRMLRGNVTAAGTSTNVGFTVALVSPGVVDVKFTTPFADPPAASVTQIFSGSDTRSNAVIVAIDAARVRVMTGDKDGNATPRDFSFIVMGRR